jgi:hypothetical protein
MAKFVPLLIVIIGVVLLVGGASAYLAKSSSTTSCEACGMEIAKVDVSTMRILTKQNETHWACCPVCGMVVAMYYQNATLQAQCFGCSGNITIEFSDGNLTSVSPVAQGNNVTMIFGMACTKNKISCSDACAENVKTTYDWAAGLPTKTMGQTFGIAQTKYSQFTVGYKPIQIPTISYGLLASGIIMFAVAPLEWTLVERRRKTEADKR